MLVGWVLALVLASLPLKGINSYERTSICLPFDVSDSAGKTDECDDTWRTTPVETMTLETDDVLWSSDAFICKFVQKCNIPCNQRIAFQSVAGEEWPLATLIANITPSRLSWTTRTSSVFTNWITVVIIAIYSVFRIRLELELLNSQKLEDWIAFRIKRNYNNDQVQVLSNQSTLS